MSIIAYTGQEFDLHVPVCIVGGGGCGLTAAVSAAKAGVEAVVFESDKTPSGSTAMTIGLVCAAGTKKQSSLGIEDSADVLFADIMAATKGETDPELARFMADQSGPAMDWLCDEVGCDFTLETNWPGYGHTALRAHGTPNRNGEELIAMLMSAAQDAGVEIVTQAKVTDLIVDEARAVRGLVYKSPDGEMTVGCDALVLACAGYGANKDLIKRFIPEMSGGAYYGCEHHRGDAIIWGKALGAAIADMGSYQGVGTHAIPHSYGLPHTVMIEGGFKVNALGQRFEDETDNISRQAVDLIAQPGSVGWIIYDEHAHSKAFDIFAGYRDNAKFLTENATADTIGDIAKITKINLDGLVETFGNVDGFISSGELCPFGRQFEETHRLHPPFYAIKVTGALYHTQGGLCIDDHARVKRDDGGVFRNLFAGGGAARSVSGPAEWGYLPAMGLATAVVFGRVAGREAANVSLGGMSKNRN